MKEIGVKHVVDGFSKPMKNGRQKDSLLRNQKQIKHVKGKRAFVYYNIAAVIVVIID